jgi:hypothetical protein
LFYNILKPPKRIPLTIHVWQHVSDNKKKLNFINQFGVSTVMNCYGKWKNYNVAIAINTFLGVPHFLGVRGGG